MAKIYNLMAEFCIYIKDICQTIASIVFILKQMFTFSKQQLMGQSSFQIFVSASVRKF
jgi:hypothetical protein